MSILGVKELIKRLKIRFSSILAIFGTQSIHKASHSLQILLFCDALWWMVLGNCLYLEGGK